MFSKLFKNLYDGDDSTSPLDGKYQNKHENLSSVDAVDELFLLALAKNTPLPESSNKMDYEDDFDGEKKNSKLNFIKKNMPRPPRRAANSSKYAKTASLAGENAEGFKKEEILNKKKSEMNSNGNEASSSYISSSAKKKLSENLAIKQSSEKSTSDVKDKFFTHATRTSESKKSPLSNSLSSFIRTNPNPKSTRPLSPQENTRRNIDETTKAPQRRLSLQDSSRFLANISSKEFPDEPSSRRPSSALLVNGRNSSQTSTSSDEKIPTYHVESHENSLNSKKVINGSERKNSMLNILSNKVKALGNSGDNNKETPIQPSLLQKRNVATTLPPLQLENQTSNSLGSKSAGPGINVKLPSKNGKSSAMTISSAGGSRSEESQNISLSNSVSPSLKHRKSSLPPQNSSGANTIIDGDISNDGLIASMKSFLWGSQPNDEKSQSSASPSESLNSKSVEKIAPKHRDVNPPLKSSLPPIPPLKGKMVNENKSGFSKKGVLFIDPNISSSTSGDGRLKSPDIKFSSNSNHWAQKESNEVPLTPARRKSIAESFFGKKRNSFQMNSERLNSSRNPNNKVDAESDLNSESEEESLTYSISFDLNDNENLSPIHPVSSSDLRRNSTRIDQNELNHITSLPGGWGSSTILQDVKYSESQASRNMNLNSDASKQKEIKRIKSPQTNPSFKKQQQINEKVVRENYVREIVSDLESATTSNTSPRSAEVKGETSLPKATSFFGGLFSRKSNENQPNVNVSNTTTSILTDGPFSSISPHASASSKSLEQTSYSQHKSNPRMQQSPSLPSLPGGFSSPEMESLDFEFIRGPNSLLNKPSSSIANTSTFQKNNDNSDFALKAKGQVKEAKATPDFKINTGDFRNPSSLQFNDPSENESWGSDSENASDESSIPPSPLHDPTAPSVFGRLFFSNFSPPKELERSLNTFSPSSKYNTSNPNNKVNFSKAALEATPSSRNQSNMSKSTSNLLEQQKNEFNRTNQRDSSYSSGAVSLKETNNKKSNLGKSTLSFSAEQHLPIQSEDSGFFGRVTSWLSKTAESPSLEDDLGLIQVDDHSEINSSKSFSTYSLDSTNSQYNTPLSTSRENVEDASFFEGSKYPPQSVPPSKNQNQLKPNNLVADLPFHKASKLQQASLSQGGHGFDEFNSINALRTNPKKIKNSTVLDSNTLNKNSIYSVHEPSSHLHDDDVNPLFFSAKIPRVSLHTTSPFKINPGFQEKVGSAPPLIQQHPDSVSKVDPVLFDLDKSKSTFPISATPPFELIDVLPRIANEEKGRESNSNISVPTLKSATPASFTTHDNIHHSSSTSPSSKIDDLKFHKITKTSPAKEFHTKPSIFKANSPLNTQSSVQPSKVHCVDLLDFSIPDVSFTDFYSIFDKSSSPEKEKKRVFSTIQSHSSDSSLKNFSSSPDSSRMKSSMLYNQKNKSETKEPISFTTSKNIVPQTNFFGDFKESYVSTPKKYFPSAEDYSDAKQRLSFTSHSIYSSEVPEGTHGKFTAPNAPQSVLHTFPSSIFSSPSNFNAYSSKENYAPSVASLPEHQFFNDTLHKRYRMFSLPFFSESDIKNYSKDLNAQGGLQNQERKGSQDADKVKRYSIICLGDGIKNVTKIPSDNPILPYQEASIPDFKKNQVPRNGKLYSVYGANDYVIPSERGTIPQNSELVPNSSDSTTELQTLNSFSKVSAKKNLNSENVLNSTLTNENPALNLVPLTSLSEPRFSPSLNGNTQMIHPVVSTSTKEAANTTETSDFSLRNDPLKKNDKDLPIQKSSSSQHYPTSIRKNSQGSLLTSPKEIPNLFSLNSVSTFQNPVDDSSINSVSSNILKFSLEDNGRRNIPPLRKQSLSTMQPPDLETLATFDQLDLDFSEASENNSPSKNSLNHEIPDANAQANSISNTQFNSSLGDSNNMFPIHRPIIPFSEEFFKNEFSTFKPNTQTFHQGHLTKNVPIHTPPNQLKNSDDPSIYFFAVLNAAMSFRSALQSLVNAGEQLSSVLEESSSLYRFQEKSIPLESQGNLPFLVDLLRLFSSSNDQFSHVVQNELIDALNVYASENNIQIKRSNIKPQVVSVPKKSKKDGSTSDHQSLFYPMLLRSIETFSAGSFACFYNLGSSFRILAEINGDGASVSAEASLLFRQLPKLKHAPPFSVLSTNRLYGVRKINRFSLAKMPNVFNKSSSYPYNQARY